tara:strand:+ start:73992 stop:74735 length:744 start_codon:yes stop_codon:yes gene_type:complete
MKISLILLTTLFCILNYQVDAAAAAAASEALPESDPKWGVSHRKGKTLLLTIPDFSFDKRLFGSPSMNFEDGILLELVQKLAKIYGCTTEKVRKSKKREFDTAAGEGAPYIFFETGGDYSKTSFYPKDIKEPKGLRLDIEGNVTTPAKKGLKYWEDAASGGASSESRAETPTHVSIQFQYGTGRRPSSGGAYAAVHVKKGIAYAPLHLVYCIIWSHYGKSTLSTVNPPAIRTDYSDDPKEKAKKYGK